MVALLGLGLAGCTDASGPEIESELTGSYTLRTINEVNLPYPLMATETDMLEITGGAIAIHGDGTFEEEITARETISAAVTETTYNSVGMWTRINNAISLETDYGSAMNGAVSDKTLTFVLGNLILIYRK